MASLTIWNTRWSRTVHRWYPPKSRALIRPALSATQDKTCRTWFKSPASTCNNSKWWVVPRSVATEASVWTWAAFLSTIDSLRTAVKCLISSTWTSTTPMTKSSSSAPQPTKSTNSKISNVWANRTTRASLCPLRLSPSKTKSNFSSSNSTKCKWSSNSSISFSSSKCKGEMEQMAEECQSRRGTGVAAETPVRSSHIVSYLSP